MKRWCFCRGLKVNEESVWPRASHTERAAHAKILEQEKHSEDQRRKIGPHGWGSRAGGGAGKEGESSLSGPHAPGERGCLHPESHRKSLEAFMLAGMEK